MPLAQRHVAVVYPIDGWFFSSVRGDPGQELSYFLGYADEIGINVVNLLTGFLNG